jgi:nucleotide-binding universal stress UspA family protein
MAIETILLAVGEGDSERTASLARTTGDIAGPTGAEVVLAHVFTEEEFDGTIDVLDFDPAGEPDPDEVAERHTTIRRLARSLDERDVDVDVRGAVGEHGETIVDLADAVGADLVVVGGRRRTPAGKAVFGSTAQTVLLSAPCPVTFVRGD